VLCQSKGQIPKLCPLCHHGTFVLGQGSHPSDYDGIHKLPHLEHVLDEEVVLLNDQSITSSHSISAIGRTWNTSSMKK
jgi:hypothetical protein